MRLAILDDEDAAEPYERVSIRVTFPKLGEQKNEITLERWIPWEQVYGEDPEEQGAEGGEDPGGELPEIPGG